LLIENDHFEFLKMKPKEQNENLKFVKIQEVLMSDRSEIIKTLLKQTKNP